MRPETRWHPRAIAAGVRGVLRGLFSRAAMDHDLSDEMRFHIDMEIAKNVRAGMSPTDAQRAALLAFGGIDRAVEAHRDARGSRLIEDAIADTRYAARALARAPGFVSVAVLTLAVAISVGTLGFTAANAFFYRPLPVPDGRQLLSVFTSDFSDRNRPGTSSYADIVDFARDAQPIADVAGESRIMLTIAATEEAQYVQGAIVTSSYFRVTRVQPALGRMPVGPDAPAVVISYSLWRRAFGADSAVVGRAVRVNGLPFTVAAVAPPEFRGINRENGVDFWIDGTFVPLVLLRDELVQRRGYRGFRVAARLRDGQSMDALNVRLTATAARLFAADREAWRDTTGAARAVTVRREQDAHLANAPRTERLLLLAGVIGFGLGLMMIACMNLASMQMARGASRRHEIATRLALGAGRGRLVRQLLAECALVAVPGIVAGVGLAYAVSALLLHYRPIPLPSWDVSLDWRALAFIVGALVVTLLIFGLMPAIQTVRAGLVTDLQRDERRVAGGLRIGSLRGGLIIAQVALSVVFTASAGLVAFALKRHVNLAGDEGRTLLVTRVNFLPGAGDSSQVETTLARVFDGIRAIPGIGGVSGAVFIPIRGTRLSVYGETGPAGGALTKRELDANYVRPGYFALLGIALLRGRDIEARDLVGAPVAVVSAAMAKGLWPGEDPIGRRIRVNDAETPAEVIGVVTDPAGFVPATDRSYPGLIYLPLRVRREAQLMLHVRVRAPGEHDAIAGQVARYLRQYDRQLTAPKAVTLNAHRDRVLLPIRLMAQGSGVLASLQFLLAVAGLWGMVAYVTERRRREIGIRTALGATRGSVLRLVMRQGVRLSAVGGIIGLVVSGVVARVLTDTLTMTPFTVAAGLLIAAAAFGVVGTIAMLIPAYRALRVTPAAALRVD